MCALKVWCLKVNVVCILFDLSDVITQPVCASHVHHMSPITGVHWIGNSVICGVSSMTCPVPSGPVSKEASQLAITKGWSNESVGAIIRFVCKDHALVAKDYVRCWHALVVKPGRATDIKPRPFEHAPPMSEKLLHTYDKTPQRYLSARVGWTNYHNGTSRPMTARYQCSQTPGICWLHLYLS